MKQVKQSQQHALIESTEEPKQTNSSRIKKKRQHRKKKLAEIRHQHKDSLSASSFEEKKNIRKMRNRDAAQRARDKSKQKFQDLSQQVTFLRTQNEFLKKRLIVMCLNCQQQTLIKQEETPAPLIQTVVLQTPQKLINKKVTQNRGFQRVPNIPTFQYPIVFGLITILACLILVCLNPTENEYDVQLRILQNIFQNDGSWKSLKRQYVQETKQDYNLPLSPSLKPPYEHFKNHVIFINRKGKQKSVIIQIQESEEQEKKIINSDAPILQVS